MKKPIEYLAPPLTRPCKREGCRNMVVRKKKEGRLQDYCGVACYRQTNTFKKLGKIIFEKPKI